MNWSPQQEAAIEAVKAWLANKDRPQIFRLFGYAGTGKTTLAKHLVKEVDGTTLFAAFTGKAAQVLRNKGCKGATTIHQLIYRVSREYKTGKVNFYLNQSSILATAKLLVVDEVSMVGEDLANDLMSFGVPILVLGDPAQLPPVKSTGFFINEDPDILLTEIHRQALDNPIIKLSMSIRKGEGFPSDFTGVTAQADLSDDELMQLCKEHEQVLCGRNLTRVMMNKSIRRSLGILDTLPVVGDKVICLRNDREKGIFNGSIWTVQSVKSSLHKLELVVKSADDPDQPDVSVVVRKEFFTGGADKLPWKSLIGTQQFTFGYCITVHKSQGSQWNSVLVIDESQDFGEDAAKHLYTAVTRSAQKLTVLT